MITVVNATLNDLPVIKELAYKIWPVAYEAILSDKQLDYMLRSFYSESTLKDNVHNKGHHFLLVKDENECIGFAAYENNYQGQLVTRIHKLYLLPTTQGKGIGRQLLNHITGIAIANAMNRLSLNVNRLNIALAFYERLGFQIIREENIELDHGYLMEDYVMEKDLVLAR